MKDTNTLLIALLMAMVFIQVITLIVVSRMANALKRKETRRNDRNRKPGNGRGQNRNSQGGQNRGGRTNRENGGQSRNGDNRRRNNTSGTTPRGPQSGPQKKTEDRLEATGSSLREINKQLKAQPVEDKKEQPAPKKTTKKATTRKPAAKKSEPAIVTEEAAPKVAKKPARPAGEGVKKADKPAPKAPTTPVKDDAAAPAAQKETKSEPKVEKTEDNSAVSYGRR